MNWLKRLAIILLSLIIGLGCAFGIDYWLFIQEKHSKEQFDGQALLHHEQDYSSLAANCLLSFDQESQSFLYTVTGSDPQIYLETNSKSFSSIRVHFSEPVEATFRLQVYIPDRDGNLSEASSYIKDIPAGSEFVEIPVPETTCPYLRFDFDGNIMIRQIETGKMQTIELPYSPDWKSVGLISTTLTILISVFVFWIIKKKHASNEQPISLSRVRDGIHYWAQWLYHLFAVVYIFGTFLTILYWNGDFWTPMSTLGDRICELIRYAMMLLWLEMLSRKPIRAVVTVAVVAVGWIGFQNSHVYRVVDLLIFFMLSDLADEKALPKMFLLAFSMMTAILALLIHLGYVNNLIVHFTYADGYALGFGHPNTTGALVLTFALLLFLVFFREHRWLLTLFCVPAAAVAWLIPASRTVTILLIALPIILALLKWIGQSKVKKILYLTPLIPWIAFACSFGFTLFLMKASNTDMLNAADGNMMARFRIAAGWIKGHGYTLLGTYIPDEVILDNCYLNVLLRYGIVTLIVVLSVFSYSFYRFVKIGRYDFVALLIIYMIYGIMERCPTHLIHCFIMFVALGVSESPTDFLMRNRMSVRQRGMATLVIAAACVLAVSLIRAPGHIGLQTYERNYGNNDVTGFINGTSEQEQTITVTSQMEGIRILAATYQTQPMGTYGLTLYDRDNHELETQHISGASIHDSCFVEAFFDKTYPAGQYKVRFYPIEAEGDSLAFWQNNQNPYAGGAAIVNGFTTENDWVFDIMIKTYSWKMIYQMLTGLFGVFLIIYIWILNIGKQDNSLPQKTMSNSENGQMPDLNGRRRRRVTEPAS